MSGQEFYAGANFPNSDFTLAHTLGEEETIVSLDISCDGRRIRPLRRISQGAQHAMAIPQHLETRSGRLDDLETDLAYTPR